MVVTQQITFTGQLRDRVLYLVPDLLSRDTVVFITENQTIMVGWVSGKYQHHTHELLHHPDCIHPTCADAINEESINILRVKVKLSMCL